MASHRMRRARNMPVPGRQTAAVQQQAVSDLPTAAARKQRQRKLLWVGVRFVISVILLAVIISKANVRAFAQALAHADLRFAVLGLGIGAVTVILSSWQWQILLQRQDIDLTLSLATGLYIVGIAFGQLLPSSIGGDVAKAAYVARLSRQGVRATSATVMARIIGLVALFLTSLPVALVAARIVPGFGWQLFLTLLALSGAFVGGLAILLSSPVLLRRFAGKRLEQSRLGRKALELATTCVSYRLQPRYVVKALLVSLVFYAASNSNFYAYGLALHLHTPFWFYWIAIPITALVTMLPISINGYGVRAASFAAVFALMGEPAALAISLALAMEVQMLIFALIGAVVALAINRRLAPHNGGVTARPALQLPEIRTDSNLFKRIRSDPMPTEEDGDVQVNEDGQVAATAPIGMRQRLHAVMAAARANQRRAVLISAGVILTVCLLALIGINLFRGTPRVTLYTVHTTMLHTTIGGGGLVYPTQSLNVAYPISAQVTKVNVQVGQLVQPGQTLVTLDSAALTSQLSETYSEWQIATVYVSTLQAQGASAKQIAGAEQQAAVAKSRYDALYSQINSTAYNKGNIVSSFLGIVTAINVTAGGYFNANATLMTIEDQSTLIVRAELPLDQVNQIKMGQSTEIVSDSRPNQTATGTVTAIIPSLTHQGNSTFSAWITVPNSGQVLFTNESVYVRVHGLQRLPTVPELAVVNPASDSIVYVFDHGVTHATHVVVGARDGDQFGIASGLQPGQQIVLVGQQQLTDQQHVIVSSVQP